MLRLPRKQKACLLLQGIMNNGNILKNRVVPVHPFLFALYPPLALYSLNSDISRASDLWLPVVLALVITSTVFLLAGSLLRNASRAALVTTAFLTLFYSYGHAYSFLSGHIFAVTAVSDGGTDGVLASRATLNIVLSASYVALLVVLILHQFRKRFSPAPALTGALTAAGLVLLMIPVFQIGSEAVFSPDAAAGPVLKTESLQSPTPADGPDIYYIILDGYARDDVLRKHYEFDNSDFLGFLRKTGFQISMNSHVNYAWTFLSLPSALNMDYLGFLQGQKRSNDRRIPYRMLRDNAALRFLKTLGYRYVHIGSTWGGTLDNPFADIQMNCSGKWFSTDLHRVLAESSWLKVFEGLIADDLAECALNQFSMLETSARIQGPKFVFTHIPLPHHPYLFDRHGNVLQRVVLSDQVDRQNKLWNQKDKYLEQLLFVNRKVSEVIRVILDRSPRPPIIILQSDHGPNLTYLSPSGLHRVRMRNFAAFFIPGNRIVMPDDITPVNQFRIIFNAWFNANFHLLKNRYFYSEYRQPFRFKSISVEKP